MKSEEGNSGDSSQVNKIALRLPQFWNDNPSLYFSQVEANFKLSGITQENTKYCSLIASLDQQTMLAIADLVRNPDLPDPYNTVKKRLIEVFEISDTKKIQTLLQDLTLGDRKPSALLRHMRDLAGTGFSEQVIKSIWLAQLPATVQSVLSVSGEKLDNLAGLADKIFEVTGAATFCSEIKRETSFESEIRMLKNEVSSLKRQIEFLQQDRKMNFRPRSRSGERGSSRQSADQNGLVGGSIQKRSKFCWYHSKYAEKAHKCMKPCAYLNE